MAGPRLVLVLLSLAVSALAGCADRPQSHASAAREAACRDRADEVYLRQNPAAVYQADQYAASTRDAPYSSAGLAGNTSSGLPGQYDRDTMLDNCLDATGGQPSQAPASQPPAPQPPARP
jgi:hypothetical protein